MKLEKKTFTSTFKGFKDGTPLKALVHLFTFAVHVLGYIYIYIYFFFFLVVLLWFGHAFSNKGRFGHKRKVPGVFYFLISNK